MGLDVVRKVLQQEGALALVDEQWVGVAKHIISILTGLKKAIDFHEKHLLFTKCLRSYLKYREKLEDEI